MDSAIFGVERRDRRDCAGPFRRGAPVPAGACGVRREIPWRPSSLDGTRRLD